MTGFSFQLAPMSGGLSVVIFGEKDCANAFPRGPWGLGGADHWTFYSVRLTDADVVAGLAETRLRECLESVAADGNGRPVVVLTTCLTEMIGSDPAPVCQDVEERTGVRIVLARTSGLRPATQARIMDRLARLLVTEFGATGPVDDNAVNFVGYQTGGSPDPYRYPLTFREELVQVLPGLGQRLNAMVPSQSSLEDWRSLPRGGVTVVADSAMYRDLLGLLDRTGHRILEPPPPKGLECTDLFYKLLAREGGRDAGAFLEGLDLRREACEALDEGRDRFRGKRLAYGIGSHHNFEASQLVWEGLGDLPLLTELGFSVDIVIQERDRPDVHERIRNQLSAMGMDLPYRLFHDPAVLAPILEDGIYDLAYLSDFLSDQARIAGIPLVRLGRLQPGYWGVHDAVRVLARALAGGFEARYRRYL